MIICFFVLVFVDSTYRFMELDLFLKIMLHVTLEVSDPVMVEVVHLRQETVGNNVRLPLDHLDLRIQKLASILLDF